MFPSIQVCWRDEEVGEREGWNGGVWVIVWDSGVVSDTARGRGKSWTGRQ